MMCTLRQPVLIQYQSSKCHDFPNCSRCHNSHTGDSLHGDGQCQFHGSDHHIVNGKQQCRSADNHGCYRYCLRCFRAFCSFHLYTDDIIQLTHCQTPHCGAPCLYKETSVIHICPICEEEQRDMQNIPILLLDKPSIQSHPQLHSCAECCKPFMTHNQKEPFTCSLCLSKIHREVKFKF